MKKKTLISITWTITIVISFSIGIIVQKNQNIKHDSTSSVYWDEWWRICGSRQSAKKRKVYHKLQSFNHYPITSFPHLIISSDTE